MKSMHLFGVCFAAIVAGCRERTHIAKAPPALKPLSFEASLVGFRASGVVATPQCEVILAGATWGTLVRVRRDGTSELVSQLPANPRVPRMSLIGSDTIIAWSHATAREEVRSLPWITVHGDFLKVFDVPHITAATFAPNGDVYAVRNYSAVWQRRADKVFATQGNWRVESRGLEVYDRRGHLLRAYQLPGGNAAVIATDGQGRVVMTLGDSTLVTREPSLASACPLLHPRVTIAATDEPLP